MTRRLAILAGEGELPRLLQEAREDAVYVTFAGVDARPPEDARHLAASFERLGALFADLHREGVGEVVFAGAMRRPALDPARFDATMHALAPRLMQAMGRGDDTLLRLVASVFEEQGFRVVGAHEIRPELVLGAGTLIGPAPGAGDLEDADHAEKVIAALSPLDVGQGAVVAGGQVMGIETLQGTDAMLRFVAETPASLWRKRGVLVKRPKAGQDLRFDMPAIGPATLRAAAAANLAGVVVAAGEVLVLDQPKLAVICRECDLFLLAR